MICVTIAIAIPGQRARCTISKRVVGGSWWRAICVVEGVQHGKADRLPINVLYIFILSAIDKLGGQDARNRYQVHPLGPSPTTHLPVGQKEFRWCLEGTVLTVLELCDNLPPELLDLVHPTI